MTDRTLQISGRQDVDAAMQAAANAFPGWRDATPSERSLALISWPGSKA